jgi:CspA family cold shock protein
MAIGTVKFFNTSKGYGFIQPEDGGNDVFVHMTAVDRAGMSTLKEGQRVNFEVVTGQNGKSAADNLSQAD